MDELDCWLLLARTPGLHAGLLEPLLARFASVEAIAAASASELAAAGLTKRMSAAISKPDRAQLEADRRWLEGDRHALLTWRSPEYPPLLKQIADAPATLFVRGRVAALSLPQIAIVGSRNPTAGGRENAESFAAHFAQCGLAVTSGLAVGIDAASHAGALRVQGVTIAVCATGLDSVYPREHAELAETIAERGALLSEFPPHTAPHKLNFPRRNRIISALSLGTLVVEAALHSGSLITARFAVEQGREVFAIPGSIHNPLARGCHRLLRMGAKLVESADDVLSELGPLAAAARAELPAILARKCAQFTGAQLDKDYKMLLDALGFDPVGIDELVERSGLKSEAVASMLLIMELDGRIESLPGAAYVRVAGG